MLHPNRIIMINVFVCVCVCVCVCVGRATSALYCLCFVAGIIWYRSLRPRKANGRGLELSCTYTTTIRSSPNICPGTFTSKYYYLHELKFLQIFLYFCHVCTESLTFDISRTVWKLAFFRPADG